MLNEIIEYKQYTSPHDSFENGSIKPRLKYNTLIKTNRAGIGRAMTIIARNCIFGDKGYPDCFKLIINGNEVFNDKDVIDALKTWYGDDCRENSSSFEQNWLKLYVSKVLLKRECKELIELCKQSPCIVNLLEKIDTDLIASDIRQFLKSNEYKSLEKVLSGLNEDKNNSEDKAETNNLIIVIDKFKRFQNIFSFLKDCKNVKKFNPCQRLFEVDAQEVSLHPANSGKNMKDHSNVKDHFNDLKKTRFESIVAAALNEGPLHRYYLACKYNPFEKEMVIKKMGSKNNDNKYLLAEAVTKKSNVLDKIFKITAFYLLQKKTNSQEYVFFNLMRPLI